MRIFLWMLWGLAVAVPAMAHHSYAMFDRTKRLTVTGAVSRFEWSNPHVYVIVDAPNGKGTRLRYSLECSSPNLLSHAGWKFNTLKAGDRVTVVFYPLRNGDPGGMLATIQLPDGTVMKAW